MEADDTIAKLHLFLETLSASEGNNWEPSLPAFGFSPFSLVRLVVRVTSLFDSLLGSLPFLLPSIFMLPS